MITLLDGPLGTELHARGVPNDLTCWSARAIDTAPDVVSEVHKAYAAAGATVHTTNTFRTNRRASGDRWLERTAKAVRLAVDAVPKSHRVAGSIAPVEDCYRPDLSPGRDAAEEHEELAAALVDAGCDLLLCETFAHREEALVAVRACLQTDTETWLALTAGPDADLMTPGQMVEVAEKAVQLGVSALLVNCTPAKKTTPFVEALVSRDLGIPVGAYANAGSVDDEIGWRPPSEPGVQAYANYARQWMDVGATLIGGCCGTGPSHIAAIRTMLSE